MAKTRKIDTYPDGSVIRLHNKRIITFINSPGEVTISFQFLDESPEIPSCEHSVTHKGKVRQTVLKLSEEALDALLQARMHYKLNVQ